MNNKKNIMYLLAGIFALVAAHLYLSFGRGVKLTMRDTPLDRSMLQADAITIEKAGRPPVELRKTDAGWVVSEPFSAGAEEGAVARILDSLALYKIRETFTEKELSKFGKRRADFALANPRIKVGVSRGEVRRRVSLGRKTPAGDGVFAAIEGDDMTYVLDPRVLEYVDIPSDSLRLKSLAVREPMPVTMFDVKRPHGVFMRLQKRDRGWVHCADTDSGRDLPASSARIEEFLSLLEKSSAKTFVWPVGASNEPSVATAPLLAGYGLDSESGTAITIRDKGRPPCQIVFGKEAENGLVYALVQNAGAVVTVDGALKDLALGSDFSDTRLFPYEPARVSRIALKEDGVDYLLARDSDGRWVMDSPVAAPADAGEVGRLLNGILSATAAERDPGGFTVSLSTNMPSESISRSVLAPGFSFSSLRSREIAKFNPSEIRRIVSSVDGGEAVASVVFDRDMRGWIAENSKTGSIVRQDAVGAVLDELKSLDAVAIVTLKATEAELAKFGLSKPAYTVSVDFFNEGSFRRNLFIGGRTSTGYYATMGAAFDAVFILSDEAVSRLTSPLLGQ